ncbi:hypothetical protein Rcas_2875 [Roseiflexus castenholzii DSM 13941]|uniref:Uncharacterized protein n=2 Tax=Roseiflexus castenholzii TaxID=120962 RepID=A7NF95_ROSCS|nr:hypothetical protein Rcas_2875 [Roseiflexus castenholzii DSM 13941]
MRGERWGARWVSHRLRSVRWDRDCDFQPIASFLAEVKTMNASLTLRLLSACSAAAHIRILVRTNSPYQPLIEAGAQPVDGEGNDSLSPALAFAGIDTVITL